MGVKDNLNALMARNGDNPHSLAAKVRARYGHGPTQPTIARIADGTSMEPKRSSLQPVADFYAVTLDDLFNSDLTSPRQTKEARTDPVDVRTDLVQVDQMNISASMGFGEALADHEEVVHRITLDMGYIRRHMQGVSSPANLRVISGHGNSMAPTINDGDMVLVDTGIRSVKIDGIYVLSANERLYIKSVRQRLDGHFEIYSDNPSVKTVDVLNGDNEVTVHGRVVMVWNGKRV